MMQHVMQNAKAAWALVAVGFGNYTMSVMEFVPDSMTSIIALINGCLALVMMRYWLKNSAYKDLEREKIKIEIENLRANGPNHK